MDSNKECDAPEGGKDFEIICGVILAFLAAVLAITNLMGGRFGDNQMVALSEKESAYSWYESKSIKQTLVRGQRDILAALLEAGTIEPDRVDTVNAIMEGFDSDVDRYDREKTEILLGSAAVGEENWAQDVDGELGQVIGAVEWETEEAALEGIGNLTDTATLFLEISLVLGAISLIFHSQLLKRLFFVMMNVLGAIGAVITVIGVWRGFMI